MTLVDVEDETEMVLMAEMAEAWSVTVDKKTLKKMTAKDIKRQDHIWGQSAIGSCLGSMVYCVYWPYICLYIEISFRNCNTITDLRKKARIQLLINCLKLDCYKD